MKKTIANLGILALLISVFTGTATAASTPVFSDVLETHWAYNQIQSMSEKGIMQGLGGNMFNPEGTITRAEFITVATRAVLSDTIDSTVKDTWYAANYKAATDAGLISGEEMPNNAQAMETPITRYEMARLLVRTDENVNKNAVVATDKTTIKDYADIPTEYRYFVEQAYAKGLLTGDGFGRFCGNENMTRAQAAVVMERLLNTKVEKPTKDQVLAGEQIKEELAKPDTEGARAAIINGFLKMEKSIDVGAYNIESLAAQSLAAEIAGIGKDENYYYVFSIWSSATVGENATVLEIQYQCTPEEAVERQKRNDEQNAAIKRIVSSTVKQGMSEYDTAKALHDYIVLNTAYDMRYYSGNAPDMSYAAYGALVDGVAVCQGYALAYQKLLEYCGVECEYVKGMANSGRHGWNIAKIDGEWYHVDTTWDDSTPNREGYVQYKYFLKSDSVMSRDHHNWDSNHRCTSTKYNNLEILSSEEEDQRQQEENEQARKDAEMAEILEYCYATIAEFSYSNEAELQATETLTLEDIHGYVYFPTDKYDFSPLRLAWQELRSGISTINPDYWTSGFERNCIKDGQWYFTIIREDVKRELERRGIIHIE